MNENQDKIIEIYSGTLWEADMVKSLLNNAEIEAFLKNTMLETYIYTPGHSNEVKVIISSRNFEKAKQIVDEYICNRDK